MALMTSPRPHHKATVAPPTHRPLVILTLHHRRSPSRTTPRPLARQPCKHSFHSALALEPWEGNHSSVEPQLGP